MLRNVVFRQLRSARGSPQAVPRVASEQRREFPAFAHPRGLSAAAGGASLVRAGSVTIDFLTFGRRP